MSSLQPSNRVKVLYVLGRGRSGSTVFANVLGAHEGFFPAGEVRFLWDPVVRAGRPCACGQPLTGCPVWSRVLAALPDVDVGRAAALQRRVVAERYLVRLLFGRGDWPDLRDYGALMGRVYGALAEVTGARVIVDSSKRPSYAAVLARTGACELYCVHMVRDPRASAYSWAHRRHGSVFGDGVEVPRRNALDATLRWDLLTLGSRLVGRGLEPGRFLELRYEDFAAAPRTVVQRVLELVGERPAGSPFSDERTVELADNHTVAGNPSRFATGRLEIRDTGEWRRAQRPLDRLAATVVAAPLLRRYGYPWRPEGTRSS